MQKGHAQASVLSGGQHLRKKALLFLCVGIQLQLNGRALLPQLDLFPHLADRVLELMCARACQQIIAVNLQKRKQRVAHRGAELVPAHGGVDLQKGLVRPGKAPALVLGPIFLRGLAHQLLKLRVAAFFCELHVIDPAVAEKRGKLVVKLRLRAAVLDRRDPADGSRDRGRAKEFEYADPFVAFDDVVAVLIFHSLDGIADALVEVGLAQGLPLRGKLRTLGQNRHKAGRKTGFAPMVPRADDKRGRHLDQTQIHLAERLLGRDQIL